MAAPRFDLVAVGNALVDHMHRVSTLPKPDGSALVLERSIGAGGVEANVAAAAARLGARSGLIARVGGDAGGELALTSLRTHGVDLSRVQVAADEETGYSLVFVDSGGDRIIMTGGLGVYGLSLDDADFAYVRDARVIFASGYVPWPILQRLARVAAEPGAPAFAFDLSSDFADLEPRGLRRDHVDALIPSIALFLTNRESLRSYTGEETMPAGIARLVEKGVRRGSVSAGEQGLSLFETGGTFGMPTIFHLPACRVPVVDTTGAGDVLHAALIASWLLAGQSAAVAGRFATAAAAFCCQGWGAQTALPTRAEAEALAATRNTKGQRLPDDADSFRL